MNTRIFATLACLLIIVGCSKNDASQTQDNASAQKLTTEQINALRYHNGERSISRSEVISYAEFAIATLDSKHPTRSGRRTIEEILPVVEKTVVKTRSGESIINDTTMYIANFADSMGYAVISCDVLASGPIAILENGSLGSLDQASDNPALNLAIEAKRSARQNMLARQEANIESISTISASDLTLHVHYNNPLYRYEHKIPQAQAIPVKVMLKTRWCNNAGFAWHCGNYPGCAHKIDPTPAAAAIAQLAYYHQIKGYTWDSEMERFKGKIHIDNVSDGSINTIRNLYGDICWSVLSEGTNKCTNSGCPNFGITVANWNKVIAKMNTMFNTEIIDVDFDVYTNAVKYDLDNDRPFVMSGLNSSKNTRHYWVADGYATCNITCNQYNTITSELVSSTDLTDCILIHCNMGRNLYYEDGYYDFNRFDIDHPVVSDPSKYPTESTENYSEFVKIIRVSPLPKGN